MTRRKFTTKFKIKVVLEALKERLSLADLAQKYELQPTQISNWKREFLDSAESVFVQGAKSKKTEAKQEKEKDYYMYINLILLNCKAITRKRLINITFN